MLSKIHKYDNLKLFHSSHEGEIYICDDDKIMIKVYYSDNIDPDFDSIIKIVNISIKLSELIPEYVPKVHLKYESFDYIALIMEKIDGMTLSQYLKINTNNHINIIIKIVNSLYNAVTSLHNVGYIHGDLHGNNIILCDDYRIKLIDFGQSDFIGSINESDENIKGIDVDYLDLKYYISLLIFPEFNKLTIIETIKNIKSLNVKNVIDYDEYPETANMLYNTLNAIPEPILFY